MTDTFVHFEIPADDPEKLMAFYSGAFGWEFQRMPMPGIPGGEYILVQTAEQGQPGINGGMYKRSDAGDTPRNFIGVASIDDALSKVAASGGTVAAPKMAIPGIGWSAFITDPEGNRYGVFQDDQNAS